MILKSVFFRLKGAFSLLLVWLFNQNSHFDETFEVGFAFFRFFVFLFDYIGEDILVLFIGVEVEEKN